MTASRELDVLQQNKHAENTSRKKKQTTNVVAQELLQPW